MSSETRLDPGLPENVGDCYLLVGYPCTELSALAFADSETDPNDSTRWKWFLHVDDGDIYACGSWDEFHEECCVDQVLLIRRAYEGLGRFLRERAPAEVLAQLYHKEALAALDASPEGER